MTRGGGGGGKTIKDETSMNMLIERNTKQGKTDCLECVFSSRQLPTRSEIMPLGYEEI